jgi:hypothetical protein
MSKKQTLLNKINLETFLRSKGFKKDTYGHYLQPNKTNTRVIRFKLSDISYRIEYKRNKPNEQWHNYCPNGTLYYSRFDNDIGIVQACIANLLYL